MTEKSKKFKYSFNIPSEYMNKKKKEKKTTSVSY